VVGAVASVLVNNLPSLSTYLWYTAAKGAGVRPSLRHSFLLGLVLVPLTMAAALGVLAVTEPRAF
jgi:hypothetical protein